jgi:cysteine desulfurase/selenocysteine lyase
VPELRGVVSATNASEHSLPGVRDAFPALLERVCGEPLVYLDSAATALKPRAVADAVARVYLQGAGAVDRSAHTLGARATAIIDRARADLASFLGASTSDEIILTRGTTDSLNLVAQAWARPRLTAGDEVLVTALEHHANLLPWQRACEETGARLVVVPTRNGDVLADDVSALLTPRTKVIALTHVSNVTGAELPIAAIAARAHAVGAVVVVDGAQGAAVADADVRALGADFYAMSGHKVYGPAATGALYANRARQEEMTPVVLGGGIALRVSADSMTLREGPQRFEAGSPNVEGAAGLSAALAFLGNIGRNARVVHARRLAAFAAEELARIPGVRIVGAPAIRTGIVSFVLEGVHAHDAATWLDGRGVAVRAGRVCAHPALDALGEREIVRASFAIYNDSQCVRTLCSAVQAAKKTLGAS